MTDQEARDERARIEQSNEVAGIVFDQVKLAWPDLHPVLDLRYGIADALWAAGYRKQPEPEWEYATARPTWPSVPVNRYRDRDSALRAVEHPPVGERPGGWIAIQRQVVKPGPWAPVGEGE